MINLKKLSSVTRSPTAVVNRSTSVRQRGDWRLGLIKEHRDARMKHFTNRSAIMEHTQTQDHPIHWNKTRELCCVVRCTELVWKEVLCIIE